LNGTISARDAGSRSSSWGCCASSSP